MYMSNVEVSGKKKAVDVDGNFSILLDNVKSLFLGMNYTDDAKSKSKQKKKEEIHDNFRPTRYVVRFVQQKALATLMITAGLLFYNSKLTIEHKERRLLTVLFITLSTMLGVLTVIEFLYLLSHARLDWNLPDTKLILALNIIGIFYVLLQIYIGYVIIIRKK